MFEFEDSKLGRIKVISITEARSAIATIMTDTEFNYVITKNNRPVRAIINYDSYRKSQTLAQPKTSKVAAQKDSSIRGLIETRERELKNQPSRVVDGLLDPPVSKELSPPPASLPVADEALQATPQTAEAPAVSAEVEAEAEVEEVYSEGKEAKEQNNDYFTRFRKLYETPRHDSLYKKAGVQKENVSKPVPPPGMPQVQNVPEADLKDVADHLPEPPSELPEFVKEAVEESRGKKEPARQDFPSIQDLLRELEDAKLSGEEEGATLESDDVKRLVNRISQSS